MQKPRARAAGPLVVVTRVLLKQRREDCPREKRGGNDVGVASAQTFSVTLHALPKFRVLIARLLQTCQECPSGNRYWIGARFPRQMEFQLGRERNRSGVVGDIKIGQESKNTLMLFLFNFLGRHLYW